MEITRYIKHFDKRHPRELTAAHVERYLSYLATGREVAASTQNQAKSALLFLYRQKGQRRIEFAPQPAVNVKIRLHRRNTAQSPHQSPDR